MIANIILYEKSIVADNETASKTFAKQNTETDCTDKIDSTGCYERSMEQMFTFHIKALIFKHYVFL